MMADSPMPAHPRRHRQVLIIGLDGATFRVLGPLVRRGYLPHLEHLLARGAHGVLLSTEPYVTGPAWTSLVTGKRPDTHGILDWSLPVPGTYRRRLIHAHDRNDLALWEILHREGARAGTLNLPVTYPPSTRTSFCVTGLLTPARATNRTHPPDLWDTLASMGYVEDVVPGHYRRRGFHAFLDALIHATRARGRAIRYCLHHYPWHAAIAVFVGPDRIQHAYWQHLEPRWPMTDETQGAIAYFQALDEEIGRTVAQLPPEAHVYLVSDHGFGPHRRTFHVNDWLEAQGYLRRRWETRSGMVLRRVVRAARRRKPLLPIVHGRLGRLAATRHAVEQLAHRADAFAGDVFGALEARVDWSRTLAFAPTPHGIQINLRGREPKGVVPPEDYDQLRHEIRQRLADVRAPDTGEPIHAQVLLREQMYAGPRRDAAPDITYRFTRPDTSWRIGAMQDPSRKGTGVFVSTDLALETGTHAPEGILVAVGPDIEPGPLTAPVPIWDILPTVLYHLELPVPADLDGQVCFPLIRQTVRAQRRIARAPAAVEPLDKPEAVATAGEDDGSVRSRLEALGYLA